jgi:cytochrome c-type biogenesis protein
VRATDWVRRHGRQVQVFGGVLLLIVGLLLVTGVWGDLMGWIRNELAIDLRLPL